jgi:hypothetical protein
MRLPSLSRFRRGIGGRLGSRTPDVCRENGGLLVAVTARDDDADGLSLINDVRILFHSSSLDDAALRQRRCPLGRNS